MPSIEDRLSRLELGVFRHIGYASPNPNLPHPNMHVDVTYTITNGTEDRTYDANASSIAELADVLYTLIQDLKLIGLVG